MPDYSNGKIYRLVCKDPDLVYYGSTTVRLSKRLYSHKANFKRGDRGDNVTSCKLFEAGDVEIFLVENYPCNTKEELIARERYYIENNPCVNYVVPGRNMREWYEANKEKKKEYNKQYRENNRDRINELKRLYRARKKNIN